MLDVRAQRARACACQPLSQKTAILGLAGERAVGRARAGRKGQGGTGVWLAHCALCGRTTPASPKTWSGGPRSQGCFGSHALLVPSESLPLCDLLVYHFRRTSTTPRRSLRQACRRTGRGIRCPVGAGPDHPTTLYTPPHPPRPPCNHPPPCTLLVRADNIGSAQISTQQTSPPLPPARAFFLRFH